MDSNRTGQDGLRTMLADWGLPCPTVPASLANRLHEVYEGSFSTRNEFEFSPYAFEHWAREPKECEVEDYVLVAHAGHGVNSWAMHYFLVIDRLQLFLQIPWGGAYMDKTTSTALVAEAFRLADELVKAAEAVPESAWPGLGPIKVEASGFYGATLFVPAVSGEVQLGIQSSDQGHASEIIEALRSAVAWVREPSNP